MARAVAQSSPVISLGYWQDCCSDSFTRVTRSTLSTERLVLRNYKALQDGSVCTASAAVGHPGRDEKRMVSGSKMEEDPDDMGVTIVVHCDQDACAEAKCLTCGMRLEENDLTVRLGVELCHASCIVCGRCGGTIDPSEEVFVHNERNVICNHCAPKCPECDEKIDYKFIHVLNKDYHNSCLKCSQCKQVFTNVVKVYAANGEPCCAACVKPVFVEEWSMRDVQRVQKDEYAEGYTDKETRTERYLPEPKIKKSRTFSTNSPLLSRAVSSSMASLTSSVALASPLSGPLTTCTYAACHHFVLYDKRGLTLMKSFCVEDCSVELLAFWLDIEQLKHFCTTNALLTTFGHQIMLKYVGYYAELPLGLPKCIEDHITSRIHQDCFTNDIFNEAQQYVYSRLENEVLPRFFESEDGQNYLKTVNLTPEMLARGPCDTSLPLKARVVDCDKRCLGSKYYVYEIDVEIGDKRYPVYRRYSEFHSLHDRMKATFSTRVLPPLPKKIYFGRSQVRGVAKQRMRDLEVYIQGLLKSPVLSCCMELRRFLTQTETDKEDEAFNKKIQKLQTS